MAEHPRIGVALLAAGSSRRFGEADKLVAPFRGRHLGEHAAAAIPINRIAPSGAVVIVSDIGHPCAPTWQQQGFDLVLNRDAAAGMATSVELAAALATKAGLDALLIALADMPLVPRAHFAALIDAWKGPGDIVCSFDGTARMPPAIFGAERLSTLLKTSGDTGGRALLEEARVIECPPQWLADIDTPERLAELETTPKSPN